MDITVYKEVDGIMVPLVIRIMKSQLILLAGVTKNESGQRETATFLNEVSNYLSANGWECNVIKKVPDMDGYSLIAGVSVYLRS